MKSDLPERTFEFAKRVVLLCRELDKEPGVSRTLANQLLRSGTSVGANVEEGQAAQSEADFISKYSIACKEARETHYWLRLLTATEIIPESRLTELKEEANQLIAILTTIIKKLRAKKITPLPKFNPSSFQTSNFPPPSSKNSAQKNSTSAKTQSLFLSNFKLQTSNFELQTSNFFCLLYLAASPFI